MNTTNHRPETEENVKRDLSAWAHDYLDGKTKLESSENKFAESEQDILQETNSNPYSDTDDSSSRHDKKYGNLGYNDYEEEDDSKAPTPAFGKLQRQASDVTIVRKIKGELKQGGHASDILTSEMKKAHHRVLQTRSMVRLDIIQKITGDTIEDIEKLDINDIPVEQRLEIQSEYIKKIEKELNNEVISKKRLLIYLRNSEKNSEVYRDKCIQLEAKLATKENLINELREGIRSLEMQLSIMDDKCFSLKAKLNTLFKNNMKNEKVANKKKISKGLPDLNRTGTSSKNINTNTNNHLFYHQNSCNDSLQDSTSTADFDSTDDLEYNTYGTRNKYSSTLGMPEPITLENIQEKLRKKEGGKPDWTRDKLNALIENR